MALQKHARQQLRGNVPPIQRIFGLLLSKRFHHLRVTQCNEHRSRKGLRKYGAVASAHFASPEKENAVSFSSAIDVEEMRYHLLCITLLYTVLVAACRKMFSFNQNHVNSDHVIT